MIKTIEDMQWYILDNRLHRDRFITLASTIKIFMYDNILTKFIHNLALVTAGQLRPKADKYLKEEALILQELLVKFTSKILQIPEKELYLLDNPDLNIIDINRGLVTLKTPDWYKLMSDGQFLCAEDEENELSKEQTSALVNECAEIGNIYMDKSRDVMIKALAEIVGVDTSTIEKTLNGDISDSNEYDDTDDDSKHKYYKKDGDFLVYECARDLLNSISNKDSKICDFDEKQTVKKSLENIFNKIV